MRSGSCFERMGKGTQITAGERGDFFRGSFFGDEVLRGDNCAG